MTSIEVAKCFTKAQEQHLKKEIRDYVQRLVLNLVNEEAEKLAIQWMKKNRELVLEAVDEAMKNKIADVVKRLRINMYN